MSEGQFKQACAEKALEDSRRMYGRMLASWASDALVLRRKGLETPGRRVYGAGSGVRRAA
ncbi:MAG: hypothetical protein IBJ10_01820 [Phycisphaerales bacterium]|nr:hypothetical protein [Phycisphaerales bacterium]